MSSWLALGAALLGFTLSLDEPSVLVVGLDGADWRVLDPLFEAGYLPHLESLVEQGARADLDCVPAHPTLACYCPPVWTSIATGQPFSRHLIGTTTDPSGRRGVPALWDVNHDADGLSNVISYRGSWPPEESAGFVLTEPGLDYAAGEMMLRWWTPLHPGLGLRETHTSPRRLFYILGLLPHEGPRPPAWQMFARDRVAMQAFDRLRRFQQVFRQRGERPRRGHFGPEMPSPTPLEVGAANLTLLVLHGIDRAQHMGWNRVQARTQGPVDEGAILALAEEWQGPVYDPPPWGWGSVASQYLEADAWIGRHLARHHYDYVVLVSDHGMGRNPIKKGVPGDHGPGILDAHTGIFSIRGPGVRPGGRLGVVSVLDVAPSIAYLLGLPVAEDLPGRVVDEAFTRSWRALHPAKPTETWDVLRSVGREPALP